MNWYRDYENKEHNLISAQSSGETHGSVLPDGYADQQEVRDETWTSEAPQVVARGIVPPENFPNGTLLVVTDDEDSVRARFVRCGDMIKPYWQIITQ